MTIFDVIRYPISYPPTAEELSRLPGDLFEAWRNSSEWSERVCDQEWIAEWYARYLDTQYFLKADYEDLARLKQMIKDYDSNESI